jgi:hypothetical protein
MMYFDSDIHMTMECTYLSAILVLYTVTCYIYMIKVCKFVYNGLDSHGCT